MTYWVFLLFWLIAGTICRADDGPRIQNMIATGIQVARGYYSIASPIYIMNGCSLDWSGVNFVQQCPNLLVIDTVGEVDITGLTIFVQVPGGACITVQGGNTGTIFNRVRLVSAYVGINFISAQSWHIQECSFSEYTYRALEIADVATPDAGDSEISGSTFSTSRAATGIYQTSGDGLRIENTKILGGIVAYQLQASPGALGDLFIVGCSIENQIWGLLIFGPYANVIISSNELVQTQYSIMTGGVSGLINGNIIVCENVGLALIGSAITVGTNQIIALVPIIR